MEGRDMRGMRGRRKDKTGLDMIKPASFYSSESEKVKLNWFCYELSLSIYDSMKNKIAVLLKRRKISNEKLADFSIANLQTEPSFILDPPGGRNCTI
jgi:hypothetical protein